MRWVITLQNVLLCQGAERAYIQALHQPTRGVTRSAILCHAGEDLSKSPGSDFRMGMPSNTAIWSSSWELSRAPVK